MIEIDTTYIIDSEQLIAEDKLNEARDLCLSGIEHFPYYPAAHGQLAKVFFMLGAREEGEGVLTNAFELFPNNRFLIRINQIKDELLPYIENQTAPIEEPIIEDFDEELKISKVEDTADLINATFDDEPIEEEVQVAEKSLNSDNRTLEHYENEKTIEEKIVPEIKIGNLYVSLSGKIYINEQIEASILPFSLPPSDEVNNESLTIKNLDLPIQYLKQDIVLPEHLFPNTDNLVNNNDNSNAKIISETMAKILVKQGHKNQAIDIYQELIKLKPHKEEYFNSKINELL